MKSLIAGVCLALALGTPARAEWVNIGDEYTPIIVDDSILVKGNLRSILNMDKVAGGNILVTKSIYDCSDRTAQVVHVKRYKSNGQFVYSSDVVGEIIPIKVDSVGAVKYRFVCD